MQCSTRYRGPREGLHRVVGVGAGRGGGGEIPVEGVAGRRRVPSDCVRVTGRLPGAAVDGFGQGSRLPTEVER